MRFYNGQHTYYCGIDLHVKTIYVCILDGTGQVLVHRNVPSTPADLIVAVHMRRRRLHGLLGRWAGHYSRSKHTRIMVCPTSAPIATPTMPTNTFKPGSSISTCTIAQPMYPPTTQESGTKSTDHFRRASLSRSRRHLSAAAEAAFALSSLPFL